MLNKILSLFILTGLVGILAFSPVQSASAGQVHAQGTFVGKSDHVTTGKVRIVKDGEVTKGILAADFNLDGAPDPKLAFGKDGYVEGTIFSKLNKLTGEQEYVLPATVDVSQYNEVWVWCEKFNVALGVAKLTN